MQLFVNSLSFRYPSEPIACYFSSENDEMKKSDMLRSITLIPKEVKATSLFAGDGCLNKLYTFYDQPFKGFQLVNVDFNDPDNEDFVKRYYNQKLKQILSVHEELMFTQSGITRDLQVWVKTEKEERVTYCNQSVRVWTLDRFTLKVRYDPVNHQPYLLVTSDRPALLLNVPLDKLSGGESVDPFSSHQQITTSMVNDVMTCELVDGKPCNREIGQLKKLHEKNIPYNASTTRPILTREMKHILGIDAPSGSRDWSSKYVRYLERITWFKDKYLNDACLREVFTDLATDFTTISEQQTGQIDASKRILRFGNQTRSNRPQEGINSGPARNCPYVEVRLIAIYHKDDKDYASKLLGYFRNGNYQDKDEAKRKRLQRYIGTSVNYAEKDLHIVFEDSKNPEPEINTALQQPAYNNLDPGVRYVGIYLSPIHKSESEMISRECYYKVKELFLKHSIVTQCIDARNMIAAINHDKDSRFKNFIYTLQNMGIAICAKTGGAPWLLDEITRKELIIGIGAFRTYGEQYIGAAFSFDNTGILCDYNYFQPSEFRELVGAIEMAIFRFSSVNNPPERLVIHYYKKLSMRHEARAILDMLAKLDLKIPVYVVSINKTESQDLVLFDPQSTYSDRNGIHQSLMPMSGCWVNLGRVREGYRFLLCNNTRYGDGTFRVTDGFPFPVKLTICSFRCGTDIDTATVEMLIGQVYQFSRIYWRSVRQQGLPVTIKYPEMIAEIMPHFESPTAYPGKKGLWFL
jgi:hypothetical protein